MRIKKHLLVMMAAFLALSTISVALAAPAKPARYRWDLAGPAIVEVTPRGKAQYHANKKDSHFHVAVRHVNLPGATLDVFVDGADVGDITLNEDGNGRLLLHSRRGDTVPAATASSVIEVRDQADGTVVLQSVGPFTPARHGWHLDGPAIEDVTPHGRAQYHANRNVARFHAFVRHVNLSGATLDVFVDGIDVGDITLNEDGNGKLLLHSRRGDIVPAVTGSSVIEVKDQAGAAVVLDNVP